MMDSEKKYFAHETAVIDEGCKIGNGVKIWHFNHIMLNCRIGDNCNLGQNVVVSPNVVLDENVKVQNKVSNYTGEGFGLEETCKAIELVQKIRNHPKSSILRTNS